MVYWSCSFKRINEIFMRFICHLGKFHKMHLNNEKEKKIECVLIWKFMKIIFNSIVRSVISCRCYFWYLWLLWTKNTGFHFDELSNEIQCIMRTLKIYSVFKWKKKRWRFNWLFKIIQKISTKTSQWTITTPPTTMIINKRNLPVKAIPVRRLVDRSRV